MNYSDGSLARLGDKVLLWKDCEGTIVCSIDTEEYSESYSKEIWGELGKGVLILSSKAGLVHITEPDEDLVFLERGEAR